jgi:hypothetical protein
VAGENRVSSKSRQLHALKILGLPVAEVLFLPIQGHFVPIETAFVPIELSFAPIEI